ncbi:hypothetical protein BPORC_0370 [Bifidobacterium porcinum]|nr:hypothetical protein BPORC_0370 [Bifidobacterium porcinum]
MCRAVGCGQQRQLSATADKRRAAKFLLLPTLRDHQPSLQPSADAKSAEGLRPASTDAGRAADGPTPAVSG